MTRTRKLPVFETAAAAYLFAWYEFATIVRLSWFPLLLASLAGYFATRTLTVIATHLMSIAAWAVIAAALHRVILFGDRARGTWLNLRFGKVEALFALPPLLGVLLLIVLDALGVPLEWHFTGVPALIAGGVMAVVLFFSARFSLIFPIAVMERRFDFAQAWALSEGNVLRMIAVWLIVTTPAYAVVSAMESLLLAVLKFVPGAPAADQFEGSLLQLFLLTYPTSIVIGALCVGILSFSYKALAGFPAEAVLKPKR